MTNDIISAIDGILAVFDDPPKINLYGKTSAGYSELIPTKEHLGYSAVQLAAERLNRYGDNLCVYEIMSQENWDLVR